MTSAGGEQDPVLRRVEDGVCWITLNRPDAGNAISAPMRTRMVEWLDEASADLFPRVERAAAILKAEFPEVAGRIRYHIPDEKEKRHGQAIAAASLPSIPVQETR